MHYYQFNIADYRKDTAHLSHVEHYIYRTLIDWYYLDELPIPKLTQSVMRRLSLGSEHLENLENVLGDFFVLSDLGWTHYRIGEEIIKYHANAEKNKVNGSKGGRPKNQGVTIAEEPKITQSVNLANPTLSQVKGNHKPITNNQQLITNIKKETQKAFSKPSFEEVSNYCVERNNEINAEAFIDFYTSNGWKVGKNSMKDWKSSVRTWERNNVTRGKQAVSGKTDSKATQFHNKLKDRYEEAVARELDSEAVQQIPSHLRSQMVIDS